MLRRALLGLAVLAACDHDVDEGVFSPNSTTPMPTTVAPTPEPGTDDGASESSGSSGGGSGTSSDGGPVDQPDPTANDTGADPTFGDPAESSSGGVDPTGVDPTGVDPTGGGAGACCEVQIGPGCGDAVIEACVCGLDAFCCSTQWDDVCVGEAAECGAGCVGGGVGGDCCTAQAVPGCSDAGIEACVCAFDDFCCSTAWDDTCVLEAADCGAFC